MTDHNQTVTLDLTDAEEILSLATNGLSPHRPHQHGPLHQLASALDEVDPKDAPDTSHVLPRAEILSLEIMALYKDETPTSTSSEEPF